VREAPGYSVRLTGDVIHSLRGGLSQLELWLRCTDQITRIELDPRRGLAAPVATLFYKLDELPMRIMKLAGRSESSAYLVTGTVATSFVRELAAGRDTLVISLRPDVGGAVSARFSLEGLGRNIRRYGVQCDW